MRGGKSFLVLLVLALGLGAYIYFVESKRDLTDPATVKDKVFRVETGKIEEVQVRTPAGELTTVKKSGEVWQVIAPMSAEADQSTVGSLVATLETMEVQRALDDNPSSVAQYGLDPAHMSVTFKVSGDATEHRLLLGGKTPTGSDVYARIDGQPRLFLVASYLEDSLNRTTFDLRDKAVLKFPRDDVDAIALGPVSLTKSADQWRLSAPVSARADAVAVDTALSRVADSQMKSIVPIAGAEPSAAELRKYGLDRPQFVAAFGAKSNRASLAFGNKEGSTAVYARDLSRPIIFTVEPALLTDLQKPAADFRVKSVFDFRSFSVKEIAIAQGGTTTGFTKTTGPTSDANPTGEVWKRTSPNAGDVNQTALTDLLNTLSSLHADTFTPTALASGDEVVVTAKSEDATTTEERVTFRRNGATVHAIRGDEPGAAVVPAADFDKALSQLKELSGTK